MKFIGLNRVCVPLSLDCDLSCRYCYRNAGRVIVPEFNALMKAFLRQIDPTKTQAVVASGGEPLLHFEKVKKLFSYVSPQQHLKVMTNGLNLTEEIVDYLNEHKVETWVSHDGEPTEYLRGADVFKDKTLLKLIKKINHLTISCCCTNKNPDPYRNYLYIKNILDRKFYFHHNALFASDYCKDLLEGFDYEAFKAGSINCLVRELDWTNPIPLYYKGVGCNVLPNGDVVGMVTIHHKYGTVLDTAETLIANRRACGDMVQCHNNKCPIASQCMGSYRSDLSEHACKILRINKENNWAMSYVNP